MLEVVGVGHVLELEAPEEDDAVARAAQRDVEPLLVEPSHLRRRLLRRGDEAQEHDVALVALERRRVADDDVVARELRGRERLDSTPSTKYSI